MAEVQRLFAPPDKIVHRVGSIKHGGPLSWPSLSWTRESGGGNERFDDPRGKQAEYTVLYGATTRRACFAETLDQYRIGHSWVAKAFNAVAPIPTDDEDNFDVPDRDYTPKRGQIPGAYFVHKRLASFQIKSNKPFLDVRITATETADALNVDPEMNELLRAIKAPPVKPGDFVGRERELTQAISLWAYRKGFSGLVYTSSHNLEERWECWALFPEVEIVETSSPINIDRDDPELMLILERFRLEIDMPDLMSEVL